MSIGVHNFLDSSSSTSKTIWQSPLGRPNCKKNKTTIDSNCHSLFLSRLRGKSNGPADYSYRPSRIISSLNRNYGLVQYCTQGLMGWCCQSTCKLMDAIAEAKERQVNNNDDDDDREKKSGSLFLFPGQMEINAQRLYLSRSVSIGINHWDIWEILFKKKRVTLKAIWVEEGGAAPYRYQTVDDTWAPRSTKNSWNDGEVFFFFFLCRVSSIV